MSEFQVIFLDTLREDLEAWLSARSFYLFPIPIEDDLPTYGIGIKPEALLKYCPNCGAKQSGTIVSGGVCIFCRD